MKRGEILFADLDPSIGSETNKKRPVLIISCNANNKASNTVTIIPLTSKTEKCYPFEVILPKKESRLPKDSKAQCQQIRTISKARINSKPIGLISGTLLVQVENALRLHLDMM